MNTQTRNAFLICFTIFLTSCGTYTDMMSGEESGSYSSYSSDYRSRMPATIESNAKTVMIDPNVHAWGAYENGVLVKAGLATAGASWCPDIGRSCRTTAGSYRIYSLGAPECKSRKFPLPHGGAPMPYCMYFNGGQALHGSDEVVEGNVSHGCVRMDVADAEWLRYDFADIGTRVVVRSY